MANYDEKLQEIKINIERGVTCPRVTVREFIGWFDVARRRSQQVNHIREELDKYKIITNPDFDSISVEDEIGFESCDGNKGERSFIDPIYRLGRMGVAQNPPLSISPDASIAEAITIMLHKDYSQLPVMTTTSEVKGVITWKSIAKGLSLVPTITRVRECMADTQLATPDTPLFSVIDSIKEHGYVLIRDKTKKISGIITLSDFMDQFFGLAEPFFLVGEIENGIRRIIHGKFSIEELRAAKHGEDAERSVEGTSSLTFGEYVRLVSSETSWNKLGLNIDKTYFVRLLDQARETRNDIMHFDPEGIDEAKMQQLRSLASLLKSLRESGAA